MSKFLSKKYITWIVLFFVAIMGPGCILYSVFPEDSSVIARVNGDDIDVSSFQKRISNIHKRKPMVRPEGGVKGIAIQNVVEDMINDRLIVQEAYKVRLDEAPSFLERVDRHIRNRSVLRLRKEEVQDKISVTEEDLRAYFDTYYEAIKIRQIFTKDRKKAGEILTLLRGGADFDDIAKARSEWGNKHRRDLGRIKRGMLEDALEEVAFALKQDEISGIVESSRGFHIIKLDGRLPPPEEKFEEVKKRIRQKLFKVEEAKRSNDYIAALKSKASIRIDTERLYSLDPSAKDCDTNTIIARVNERPINACHFMEEASRKLSRRRKSQKKAKHWKAFNQEILDRLITYELVEQEALKRNYMNDPLFKKDVEAYKDNLLINLFKQEMILPRAIPSEEELKEYYETHKDEFKKDDEVWFGEMTFSNPDVAEAVLRELKEGANFEFLASQKSLSNARTGIHSWTLLGHLSAEIREGIKGLDVGGLSDIIEDSRKYKIIKLKGRREGGAETFSRIIDKVRQVVVKRKFNKWLQEYLEELRSVSSIYVHKKLLNKLTERYTEGT